MPYQGMDFSGLGNFGKILEQGYKDKLELERQRDALDLQAANYQQDNLLKAQQNEALYGPMGGSYVAPEDLMAPDKLAGFQNAAQAGLGFKQKNVVVTPRGSTPNIMTIDGPGASAPGGGGANIPTVANAGQQVLTAQGEDQSQVPGLQEDGSFLAPSGRILPKEVIDAAQARGGKITPEGLILMPNDQVRRLQEDKKENNQMQLLGARLGARPDMVTNAGRGYGGMMGGGAGANPQRLVTNPLIRTYQGQIADIDRTLRLTGIPLQMASTGSGKTPDQFKAQLKADRDELVNQMATLPQTVQAGGMVGQGLPQQLQPQAPAPQAPPPRAQAPAPKAAAPAPAGNNAEVRWQNYLRLHPIVVPTPQNKEKFMKGIGA